MSAIIKTTDLRKVYKIGNEKVVALDVINLEIDKGQVCCILGTSGSGKSTLLNQLAGLEKPTRGTVHIKGKCISVMSEKQLAHFRQRNIGFVFQSYNLLQGMSAVDNVAIPLTFRGMAKRKRLMLAKEMLRAVGLGKRMTHKPSEMSGGQQQRVGIARAFVAKPDVVFADEPTGNLDTRTTREVMDLFLSFARQQQITIVLVTHDRGLARYADRIVTIVDGNIVSDEVNHSLYDITNELCTEISTLMESRETGEVASLLLTRAEQYGDGVSVQALERLFADDPDISNLADELLRALDKGSGQYAKLERLIEQTGMLEEEKPPEKLPEKPLELPTEILELVDNTAEDSQELQVAADDIQEQVEDDNND